MPHRIGPPPSSAPTATSRPPHTRPTTGSTDVCLVGATPALPRGPLKRPRTRASNIGLGQVVHPRAVAAFDGSEVTVHQVPVVGPEAQRAHLGEEPGELGVPGIAHANSVPWESSGRRWIGTERTAPVQGRWSMNTQLRRWIADGPDARQRGLVAGARVALVRVEAPPGVGVAALAHHAGRGCTLATIEAAAIERQDASPFTILVTLPVPDEVPVAVEQHLVGDEAEALDGAPGGQALRLGHAELVALLGPGMTDRPGVGPVDDALVHDLALALGEHLGVTDLGQPPVLRDDHGAEGQRTGPRAPPDLVDADDDVVAQLPQVTLASGARRLALQAGSQRRRGARSHDGDE